MRLLLVRHPAPAIEAGICYGRTDVPLRADSSSVVAGIVEAVRESGVGVVWSSPASRCLAPAREVAAAIQAELRVDPRLQELDFGAWEGRRWDAVARADLDRWAADPLSFAPRGGETGLALLTRVRTVFQSLLLAGVDCAVISHGGPLRVLGALARGVTPDLLASPPPFGAVISLKC
jgi:alpha-ribazole phosphatase